MPQIKRNSIKLCFIPCQACVRQLSFKLTKLKLKKNVNEPFSRTKCNSCKVKINKLDIGSGRDDSALYIIIYIKD